MDRYAAFVQYMSERDGLYLQLAGISALWVVAWVVVRRWPRLAWWYLVLGLGGFYGTLVAMAFSNH